MKSVSISFHEPARDPRVVWTVRSLSKRSNVRVVGLDESDVTKETISHYDIKNIETSYVSRQLYIRKLIPWMLINLHVYTPKLSQKIFVLLTGAIGIVFFSFFDLLRRFGNLLIVLTRSIKSINNLLVKSKESIVGIIVRGHGIRFLIDFVDFARKVDELKLAENYDLIWVNDFDSLIAGVKVKYLSGNKTKLIYDMHEFWPYQFKEPNHFIAKVEKYLIHNFVDEIFIVNHLLGQKVKEKYGLNNIPIFGVPNASPLETKESIGFDEKVNPEKVTFIFQGGFARERGIEFLVEAWKKANRNDAILILRGPNSPLRNELIYKSKEDGTLDKNIFFPEAVKESELIKTAVKADIGIIPYRPISMNNKFACPNKLSQYLQAGLHILYNDLPFVESVLKPHQSGDKYEDNDLDGFNNKVDRIISNIDEIRKTRELNREIAIKHYNWEVLGDKAIEEMIQRNLS